MRINREWLNKPYSLTPALLIITMFVLAEVNKAPPEVMHLCYLLLGIVIGHFLGHLTAIDNLIVRDRKG